MRQNDYSAFALSARHFVVDVLLPYWLDSYRQTGGFVFAFLDRSPKPPLSLCQIRAQQLYVLSHAAAQGWARIDRQEIIHAARAFIALSANGTPEHGFSLGFHGDSVAIMRRAEDQFWALIALTWAHRASGDERLQTAITALWRYVEKHFSSQNGGFHESTPVSLPRTLRPHLRALEAFIALHETTGNPEWLDQADATAHLFETQMIDQTRGVIAAEFDLDWTQLDGTVAEPEIAAQWAFVLARYDRLSGRGPSRAGNLALQSALVAWESDEQAMPALILRALLAHRRTTETASSKSTGTDIDALVMRSYGAVARALPIVLQTLQPGEVFNLYVALTEFLVNDADPDRKTSSRLDQILRPVQPNVPRGGAYSARVQDFFDQKIF